MDTKADGPRRGELERRGFVELGRVLDASTVATLRGALADALGADPQRSGYGILRHDLRGVAPAFEAGLAQGGLAAHARELLGLPAVVLFQDILIWKPPGTEAAVAWHQDYSYWPLDAPRGVTLWVALDDATEENGCLRFMPGTHRLGERRPAEFVEGATQPLRPDLPSLDAEARAGDAVAVPLHSGEALAHHPLVWHASPGNRTATDRRAWSITFVHPDVRWLPSHAPHPWNHALAPRDGDPLAGPRFPRLG